MRKFILSFIIVILFVLPRIFLIWHEEIKTKRILWPDEANYHQIAFNIITHYTFSASTSEPYIPTGYRGPVYPFFLSVIYYVSRTTNPIAVYIVQTIILLLLMFFLIKIAQSIIPSPAPWFFYAIAVFCALYPACIIYPLRIMPDFLFTFLIVLYAHIQIQAIQTKKSFLFFLGGLILGITALTKPAALALPFCMSIFFIRQFKKQSILFIFLIFLGFIIPITPWSIRNKIVLNTYKPILQAGKTLYPSAMNRVSDIPLALKKRVFLYGQGFLDKESFGKTEAEADNEFIKRAVKLIAQHPFVYLKYSFYKGYAFWKEPIGYNTIRSISKHAGQLFLLFYIFILIVSFTGIIMLGLYHKPLGLIPCVIILYFFIFHSLTHSITRYHLPCLPFMSIGLLFVIQVFFSKLKNHFSVSQSE